MSKLPVCPFCRETIALKPGGSIFLSSQVERHLMNCTQKPAKETQLTVFTRASQLLKEAGL